MTDTDILGMLKVDLGIKTTSYDDRLTQYITSSRSMIEREGVTFDATSIEDCQLNVMYAAWMWRRRDFPMSNGAKNMADLAGMPRMLRFALNNRVISEKMRAE